MVRSLWTGATGMIAQQLNVDNISNNLANVNTTGYKAEVMEFKSLLYQTIQTKTTTANGANKPIGTEVGLGVRNNAITAIFTDGSLLETPGESNFALNGRGFIGSRGADGQTFYTRNGNIVLAVGTEGLTLETTDGLPVLNSEGEPIVLEDDDMVASKISVGRNDGMLYYPDEKGVPQSLNSGEAMNEAENENLTKTKMIQGYLEGSNVQIADEMVNLIVAQRAYEVNSKVITTSDEMLQQANQLKR